MKHDFERTPFDSLSVYVQHTATILDFKISPCSVCYMLSFG